MRRSFSGNTTRGGAASRRALALGGGALASAGLIAGAAASMPEPNPDSELIAICRQYIVDRDAVDQAGDIPDDHPLWLAFDRTQAAICNAKPLTIDGVVAKARAAKAVALNPDGSEDPVSCVAEIWAWDLVNDLLRLAGRA